MAMTRQSTELQVFVKELLAHQSALRGYIVSLMPGSNDAEDVLQDVNVIIWEKMNNFEDGANFRAWIFAIARNTVKAQFRNNKHNLSPSVDADLIHAIDELWHQRDPQEITRKQSALDRCLEQLKQTDRNLIRARYTKGTNLEIHAQEIGRPADSLRTSLSRVRAKLRNCVQSRLTIEGGVA
jgi:RNA polymerase sigma-70 factor (ECF subfamily)